ncbi:MAG TPA: 1-phosphofructokinase [Anaerolineaceae bacterium]|nr:1-phosphofructokinase [Anaerolineaceae bacterium]
MIYTVTLNPALDKEYRVPELLPNTILRASAVKLDYGGKGFNIARMLAIFETDCIALGFVGGHTGEVLSQGLKGIGIKTDFVHVSEETRTNISAVSDKDNGYIKINEPGPEVSIKETDELLQKIENLIQPGDWWVLSGSLPPGIPVDIYAQMIKLLNKGGARTILDSSGDAFKLGCMAEPFLIKPNLDEIAQIFDGKLNDSLGIEKTITRIHEIGVKNIILSAGKDKAFCSDGMKRWIGIPPKINEMNPIGAGDAMLAAIVYRLSRNETILNAFTWGLAAGTAAASLPGTMMPVQSDVERFINKVVICEE